ncbi:MAG: tetratricopeptide repeat protein [Luteibaculaceae bacterium]
MTAKPITLFLVVLFVSLLSCSGETDKAPKVSGDELRNEITRLEKLNFSGLNPSLEDAQSLLAAYQKFAKQNPNDSLTPDYIFKASGLALGLTEAKKAIELIDILIDKYPDYPMSEEAMFQKAFIFDFNYGDKQKAEQAYKAFLDKYPNSSLAGEAKSRIEYLSLSDEELIEMFKKKNN